MALFQVPSSDADFLFLQKGDCAYRVTHGRFNIDYLLLHVIANRRPTHDGHYALHVFNVDLYIISQKNNKSNEMTIQFSIKHYII